jgi:hypothetical protein
LAGTPVRLATLSRGLDMGDIIAQKDMQHLLDLLFEGITEKLLVFDVAN